MSTEDIRALILSSLAQGLRFLHLLIAVGVLIMLASGIKSVKPNEAALVLRFGKLVGATRAEQIRGPGLLLAFPYPIDEIVRVPVRQVKEIVIDELWYPTRGGLGFPATTLNDKYDLEQIDEMTGLPLAQMGASIDPVSEGYCLTGDNYILQPLAVVKYQVGDPIEYALNTNAPEEILESVVVEQLTRAIGESAVDEILTREKRALGQRVLHRTQTRLDRLKAGIDVVAIEFKELIPPRHVLQEFQRVVSAAIQSQTIVREAEAYRARELPKAESDGRSTVLQSRADSLQLTAEASVRVTAFKKYLPQYGQSGALLRWRLTKETLEEALAEVKHLYLIPGIDRDGPPIRLLLPGDER
jgi:membrane protease subunit HflK